MAGLKKVLTGGAPVFPAGAKRIAEAFLHAQISVVYGSSKAEPISVIKADEIFQNTQKLLPAGKVNANTSV